MTYVLILIGIYWVYSMHENETIDDDIMYNVPYIWRCLLILCIIVCGYGLVYDESVTRGRVLCLNNPVFFFLSKIKHEYEVVTENEYD